MTKRFKDPFYMVCLLCVVYVCMCVCVFIYIYIIFSFFVNLKIIIKLVEIATSFLEHINELQYESSSNTFDISFRIDFFYFFSPILDPTLFSFVYKNFFFSSTKDTRNVFSLMRSCLKKNFRTI